MAHRFTRQELYDLVWSEPKQKLAPRLGISDVWLAKACRHADIPVPERGYWAQLHAGKAPAKRPLPPRGVGMSDTVSLGRDPYSSFGGCLEEIAAMPVPPPPTFGEEMTSVVARVERLVRNVTVPRTLERAHPLVARLLAEDEGRRERQRTSTFPSSLDAPRFESPIELRRLRIINGLFLALQRFGGSPWMRDRLGREIGVEVGDTNVGFTLDAIAVRQVAPRGGGLIRRKRAGSERLRLTIPGSQADPSTAERTWEDGERGKLETQVRGLVVALIVAGEARYRAHAVSLRDWMIQRKEHAAAELRRQREEAERRERERLATLEKERLDRLFASANNWRRAADLRAFVQAVQVAHRDIASPEDRGRLAVWTADALAAADRLDPLGGGRFRLEVPTTTEPTAPAVAGMMELAGR
jgi:hypothetical protein